MLAASIQSRRYALRTIVHLPKHEVGEGEAHERQHRGIVRREGLVPKVVSPDAPVIQAVDAAGLKVAAELEIVSSAHPRHSVSGDVVRVGVAVRIGRPNRCLGDAIDSGSSVVDKIHRRKILAVGARNSYFAGIKRRGWTVLRSVLVVHIGEGIQECRA